ncbi:MAG: hypothetical protein ACYC1L_06475 [Alphaproteobacteria bacterium]
MGYFLGNQIPDLTWIACDLPSSLAYNACRLAVLLPKKRHVVYLGSIAAPNVDPSFIIRSPDQITTDMIVNVPHFLLPELTEIQVELAFNAWSMAEMSEQAVAGYARNIASMIRERGIFAELNLDATKMGGCDPATILSDFFSGGFQPVMPKGSTLAMPMRFWFQTPKLLVMEPNPLLGFKDGDDSINDFSFFPVSAWDGLKALGLRH